MFHEVTLPGTYHYGSRMGPGYETRVTELDTGFVISKKRYLQPRHVYQVTYDRLEQLDVARLIAFWQCRRGTAYGFRMRDQVDYVADVEPVINDGGTLYLAKKYVGVTRILRKPVPGTTRIWNASDVEQFGFTVDTTTGIVTGLSWELGTRHTSQFDVPVRFDSKLNIVHSEGEHSTVNFGVRALAIR